MSCIICGEIAKRNYGVYSYFCSKKCLEISLEKDKKMLRKDFKEILSEVKTKRHFLSELETVYYNHEIREFLNGLYINDFEMITEGHYYQTNYNYDYSARKSNINRFYQNKYNKVA